jgi:DNA-binding NarL/FixJ family response regulator
VSVCFDILSLSVYPDTVNTEEPPSASPSADPSVGLRAVLALRRLTERVEAEQVARARDQGWSWQQIADGLGMTRQSVHAKYGGAL